MVRTCDSGKEQINWVHSKINEGNNYFVKTYFEMSQSDVNCDLLVMVRDSPDLPHAVWNIYCDKEMKLELYEGVSYDSYGDGLENENNNRNMPRLPLPYRYSIFKDPVITDYGYKFYESYFGNGHIEGTMASGRGIEFIGKRDTDYLFRLIKEAAGKGVWIDFHLSYYLQTQEDLPT